MSFDGMTKKEIVQYAFTNGHATVMTQLENSINGYGFTKAASAPTATDAEYIAEQKLRQEIDNALRNA